MELDYYLWDNDIPHKAFAKNIGIAPPTLSVFVNKKRSPFLATAIKIHYETKGSVSLYELLTLKDRKEIDRYGFTSTSNGFTSNSKKDKPLGLDYYLWDNKILHKAFAKNIGIAPHTLSVIANKKRTPLLITAIKIYCETKGAVPLHELLTLKDREEIEKKYSFVTKNSVYNVGDKEDK